ncbi:methylmalonyl-CoA mutase small subunit [Paludibacter sp. 221]|uniref:methylmalonyl-CoA mutase small subunit n=1 Tax=Paludibacter sp. 221 TaxID=2302939 RepID=UPI0013D244DE|nr:methylmalonyl-CoA mutase small subunit [Paludibacter sp. 221]NDV46604.1 methylmalonyl-CoA mutase small subunit [Paludibacter sp. 221]
MAKNKLNLLADFPAVTTQEWMEKIVADLKGADFDKKLIWKTNEGFSVRPFYRTEDIENLEITNLLPGEFPYVRGTKTTNEWHIRQEIKVEDPAEANKKALDILNKGVTSIGFKINKKDLSAAFIAILLHGIQAESVELNFQTCISCSADLLTLLHNYFKSLNYDPMKLHGSVNFDPISKMLLKGKNLSEEEITQKAIATIEAANQLPYYRVIGVNALTLTNAGAHITQELGYALAWGNQYIAMLDEAGIDPATAAKRIKFNFGVGSNYFMEIAKFRAARLLWALIVEKYLEEEVEENRQAVSKMHIHAETTTFNMTVFDANVNMLRTQTEAMSASIGGVDSLTVLPYDCVYKNADDFSERIARNQQLLLKEESHFDKVTDPSAGSYYIETLTNEIAKQAWKLFLDIEEQGGFLAAVKSGSVQKNIKETADSRLKAISSRKEVLLGTNQFPNFTESASQKVDLEPHTCKCGCSNEHGQLETLPCVRGGEEFEALRFATEKAAKRPKAFMLTIGNLAMRLARAQFSSNFFACAGYEIIDNLGFNTVDEGVKAAEKAGADIIILCSSDEEYETLAPEAYKLAKDKFLFVVAGAPASMDDLKAQGIQHFINVRSNVLTTLQEFNRLLNN